MREALNWAQDRKLPVLVLGGGSNLVFRSDFQGLVLRICIRGRSWERAVDHQLHAGDPEAPVAASPADPSSCSRAASVRCFVWG